MKCIRRYFQAESLHPKISILGIVLVFLFFVVGNLNAQNQSPEVLKQQMAKIRQSTNWEDPVAAKNANDQIRELSKKLMMTGKPPDSMPQGLSKTEAEEMKKEGVDDKMKLWNQMMIIAREGGEWDLAKPLREEIVEEYKADESFKVLCQEYLDEMTYLCIDMSMPGVQEVIDQMENYKAIKTLVITGGKYGAAVNLELLISKASKYPLQQLCIINFRNFVTSIPKSVGNFQKLTSLMLFNNQIRQLPTEIGALSLLQKFYVDINPLSSLIPSIRNLNALDTLGIAKTQITEAEVNRIKLELPNCKILLK